MKITFGCYKKMIFFLLTKDVYIKNGKETVTL